MLLRELRLASTQNKPLQLPIPIQSVAELQMKESPDGLFKVRTKFVIITSSTPQTAELQTTEIGIKYWNPAVEQCTCFHWLQPVLDRTVILLGMNTGKWTYSHNIWNVPLAFFWNINCNFAVRIMFIFCRITFRIFPYIYHISLFLSYK